MADALNPRRKQGLRHCATTGAASMFWRFLAVHARSDSPPFPDAVNSS